MEDITNNYNIESMLFRFIAKKTSPREDEKIQQWLEADEENVNLFLKLKQFYEEGETKSFIDDHEIQQEWEQVSPLLQDRKKRHLFFPIQCLLAVACIALICCIGTLLIQHTESIPEIVYQTMAGERRLIELPDGSNIWMNANTQLTIAQNFGREKREVALQGEAWFDIAKAKEKAFVVYVDDIQVAVHGTQFNVSNYAWQENVVTSLEEGSVSLQYADRESFLKVGDVAKFNKEQQSIQIDKNKSIDLSSWKQNKLVFQNESLSNIIKTLENHYGVSIQFNRSENLNDKIRITVEGETIDEALSILSLVTEIEFKLK